jgi:adenylate cyclase
MKYRTKLRIGFITTCIGVNLLSLAFLYQLSHKYLLDEFRKKTLAMVRTTATMIDGDLHDQIRTRDDQSSSAYATIQAQLKKVRDQNRQDGNFVRYAYTLRPKPGTKHELEYVVDPEEDTTKHAYVGEPFGYPGEPIWVDRGYVEEEIFTDKTGSWLSGYAPVKNSKGEMVAVVEVDIDAGVVVADLRPVGLATLGSVLISVVCGFAVTFWLSNRVAQPLMRLRSTLERIGQGDLTAKSDNQNSDEFGEVARVVNQMVDGLRERDMVKSAFARYVSQQVIDNIIKTGKLPALHGDRRKITALFSDIRGFTTISETMNPGDVVEMLNEYFKSMVDIVFRHKGTLDKFMGDGMMVIFGAPAEDSRQEEHAVQAAIEMQQELQRLCRKWESEKKPTIRIGIGINTGFAIVGNIGSEARMEYTAIGDVVNTASRLESVTKEHGVDILISDATLQGASGLFETVPVGNVHLKGRVEAVRTYSVPYEFAREGADRPIR